MILNTYCVLIAGSRTYNDYNEFCKVMNDLLYDIKDHYNIEIVQGGAKGADYLAKRYASQYNYKCTEINADWNLYGKSAGYKRNTKMHEYINNYENKLCICFWDELSKGTRHNFKLAKDNSTILYVYSYNKHNYLDLL